MEYVFYLDWADKSKTDLMGRRGELLNIALEKDVRLQRTGVVSRETFQSFLLETGIKEEVYALASAADHTSSEDLKQTYGKIRQKILDAELPWDMEMELTSMVKGLAKTTDLKMPYLILYPSFGQIPDTDAAEDGLIWSLHPGGEPRLGLTSSKELIVGIRNIWADLFSPESIKYRRKKGIKDEAAYPAVLVQTISQAKQSGLVLSHMGPSESSKMGVSAIYGLLPAVYEEELDPDVYTIETDSWDVVSKEVNKQTWRYGISDDGEVIKYRVGESRQGNQKINDKMIVELARTAKRMTPEISGVLRMAWTITTDGILVTECQEILDEETGSVGTAGVLDVAEVAKETTTTATGDVYDTGMFGGWFADGTDASDELNDDDAAPSVPTQVTSPVPASTATTTTTPSESTAAAGTQVQTVVVQAQKNVVNLDMSDVNLNEESLGTKIFLDILTPEDVKRVEKGYYNGAFILTDRFFVKSYYGAHPNVLREKGEEKSSGDDLAQRLKAVAKVLRPLPLIVKLSDYASDDYQQLEGSAQYEVTDDKFLNWRGASRYIHPFFKQAFKNEILTVKAVRELGYTNIHVMIPFVRTPAELDKVLKLVKECAPGEGMKIWMMMSLPSNLAFFDKFAKRVDGILLDYYMMSLVQLGLDPSIEKPDAVGHILKQQYDIELYNHVLGPVKSRAKRDLDVVLYDRQGVKDPDVLDLLVPNRVNGLITSSKEILKVYPSMANAERRFILNKLMELED